MKIVMGKGAKLPVYGSEGAAGLDIFSSEPSCIPAGGLHKIKTGIKIELPLDTYGRIAPRSGLSLRCKLNVMGEVIDPDYRGEIIVLLMNHSSVDVRITKHQAIAQLILEKFQKVSVQVVDQLSTTKRDCDGFGSTDKN